MDWMAGWLIETTWQVALLVVVIALVQMAVGRWMSPRARYAMWMIVVVRLALPVLPASGWSVYGWMGQRAGLEQPVDRSGMAVAHASSVTASDPANAGVHAGSVRHLTIDAQVVPSANVERNAVTAVMPAAGKVREAGADWRMVGLAVWAGGALLMLARVGAQSVRGMRLRRRARRMTLDELDCDPDLRGRIGWVAVMESGLVRSPALCGLVRPAILLPEGLAATLGGEQLEQVIRHELAHVGRCDHWTNAAMRLLQAVHWFNPLIWFAFSRCKLERELACDEAVLREAESGRRELYGRTLLAMATQFGGGTRQPMLTMAEGKRHLKRRIRSIAVGPGRGRSGVLAVVVCAVFVACGLTAAQTAPERQASTVQVKEAVAVQEAAPVQTTSSGSGSAPEIVRTTVKAAVTEPKANEPTQAGPAGAVGGDAGALRDAVRKVPETVADVQKKQVAVVTCLYDWTDLVNASAPAGVPLKSVASGEYRGPSTQKLVEQTADLIRDTIEPGTWCEKGGNIGSLRLDVQQNRVFITHTQECQAQIRALLDRFRSSYDVQITVEVRLVALSGDKLLKKDRDWIDKLRQGDGTLLSDVEVSRLLGLSDSPVTAPRVTVYDGGSAMVAVCRSTCYVADLKSGEPGKGYEPVIRQVDDGISLEVHAAASQDRRNVILSVAPKMTKLTGIDQFTYSSKPESLTLQQPKTSEWAFNTQAVIPSGKTAILGISQIPMTREVVSVDRGLPKAPKATLESSPVVHNMVSTTGDVYVLVKPVIIGPVPK